MRHVDLWLLVLGRAKLYEEILIVGLFPRTQDLDWKGASASLGLDGIFVSPASKEIDATIARGLYPWSSETSTFRNMLLKLQCLSPCQASLSVRQSLRGTYEA